MAKAKAITGLNPAAPTGKNARKIALGRLEELYARSSAVDQPYALQELHDLRIAAKRLRYTLEIFADELPAGCEAVVSELTQIQDELGQLHDSDVLIALLRLCLGSQENPLPERALAQLQRSTARSFVWPDMVVELLDRSVAPSAEQRYGLEQLLRKQQQTRTEQYQTFRRHWYRLQEQDFRRQLLDLLQ
ncbi:MAG: CHAD domain-containing protein [Ktedonobacteraceae bacterium]|nr:CHAD domain-containing protein [Ktedonobacteraceae bacterium]MBO0789819.1 CHAD domain-containing protein [Ktedonobacteraceae bacterium]